MMRLQGGSDLRGWLEIGRRRRGVRYTGWKLDGITANHTPAAEVSIRATTEDRGDPAADPAGGMPLGEHPAAAYRDGLSVCAVRAGDVGAAFAADGLLHHLREYSRRDAGVSCGGGAADAGADRFRTGGDHIDVGDAA